MIVNNHIDRFISIMDQPFQEIAKHIGIHPAVKHHKTQSASQAYRRNHIHLEDVSGGANNRRLAYRSPSGSSMIIRANARLVGIVYSCSGG